LKIKEDININSKVNTIMNDLAGSMKCSISLW
jgi:hypothetical protein